MWSKKSRSYLSIIFVNSSSTMYLDNKKNRYKLDSKSKELLANVTFLEFKEAINSYLDKGLSDKQDIYTKVVDDLGVPRPTVRRIARDLREELLDKIKILQSEAPKITMDEKSSEVGEEKKMPGLKHLNQDLEELIIKIDNMELAQQDEFEQDKLTFKQKKSSLQMDPHYRERYVAIVKNEVVDDDTDKLKLAKRVYEKYGYVPMYVGFVGKKSRRIKIPSIFGVKK